LKLLYTLQFSCHNLQPTRKLLQLTRLNKNVDMLLQLLNRSNKGSLKRERVSFRIQLSVSTQRTCRFCSSYPRLHLCGANSLLEHRKSLCQFSSLSCRVKSSVVWTVVEFIGDALMGIFLKNEEIVSNTYHYVSSDARKLLYHLDCSAYVSITSGFGGDHLGGSSARGLRIC